jgi:hypothetical protein
MFCLIRQDTLFQNPYKMQRRKKNKQDKSFQILYSLDVVLVVDDDE